MPLISSLLISILPERLTNLVRSHKHSVKNKSTTRSVWYCAGKRKNNKTLNFTCGFFFSLPLPSSNQLCRHNHRKTVFRGGGVADKRKTDTHTPFPSGSPCDHKCPVPMSRPWSKSRTPYWFPTQFIQVRMCCEPGCWISPGRGDGERRWSLQSD